MDKISIIVPVFNRVESLELTLIGFMQQSYKNFEIIIVNDGGIATIEDVVNKFKNDMDIKYIYQQHLGRAATRNRALGIASGEYLIFNDDDRIPSRDFLYHHLRILQENRDVVTIGKKHELLHNKEFLPQIDSTKVIEFARKNVDSYQKIFCDEEKCTFTASDLNNKFDSTLNKWDFGISGDNRIDVINSYGNNLAEVRLGWMLATTANIGVNRAKFEPIIFDEMYQGWGMEDTDYAYQLYKNGAKFQYVPGAINYHQVHYRDDDNFTQLRENIRFFCYKYPGLEVYLCSSVLKRILTIQEANDVLNKLHECNNPQLVKTFMAMSRYISNS
jgi:GT2 family glycosyltransferase